jgi:Fe-Mn family superoxide dismutase
VNGANGILERLDKARQAGTDVDMKPTAKELSFNVDGHILHSLFWSNLAPAAKASQPHGATADALKNEFGTVERFTKEFSAAAVSTEGSGWAALRLCGEINRPMMMQIEKHNVNAIPPSESSHGPRRMGACLLHRLQGREGKVRGGLLKCGQLGGGQQEAG